MAKLEFELMVERQDCGLQTLQNLCRAAVLYLELTPEADWPFTPAEAELIRDLAAEVEGCVEEVFSKVIPLQLEPVYKGKKSVGVAPSAPDQFLRLRRALIGLVGAEDVEELRAVEKTILALGRALPVPDDVQAATLDAVRALIETADCH
jgi:hypothetical protein